MAVYKVRISTFHDLFMTCSIDLDCTTVKLELDKRFISQYFELVDLCSILDPSLCLPSSSSIDNIPKIVMLKTLCILGFYYNTSGIKRNDLKSYSVS